MKVIGIAEPNFKTRRCQLIEDNMKPTLAGTVDHPGSMEGNQQLQRRESVVLYAFLGEQQQPVENLKLIYFHFVEARSD